MTASRDGAPLALSMRERAEVDTLYQRVFAGEHYRVLGVDPDATAEDIQRAYLRLTRWLDVLQHPDRDLGNHRPRVEVVATAVENAFRIVGNPRERMLYDGQRTGSGPRPAVRREPAPPAKVSATQIPAEAQREPAVSPWRGAASKPLTAEQLGSAATQLVDLLDAHLSCALDRDVSLRDAAGGEINLDDSVRYARRAEQAEQAGRWADAAVQWHLVLLTSPRDSTVVLRTATALRWAGASTRLFERYTRLVNDQDLHGVPMVTPRAVVADAPQRTPSRRPTRR